MSPSLVAPVWGGGGHGEPFDRWSNGVNEDARRIDEREREANIVTCKIRYKSAVEGDCRGDEHAVQVDVSRLNAIFENEKRGLVAGYEVGVPRG